MTVSGVYAQVRRGGDDWQPAVLNRQLPRWNYLANGSYIEIDPDYWRELLDADAIDDRGRCGKITEDRGDVLFLRPSSVPYVIDDEDGDKTMIQGAQLVTATAFRRTSAHRADGLWYDARYWRNSTVSIKPAVAVY